MSKNKVWNESNTQGEDDIEILQLGKGQGYNPGEEKSKVLKQERKSALEDSIDSPRERKSFCGQITISGKLKIGVGVTLLTIAGFGLVAVELYNTWFEWSKTPEIVAKSQEQDQAEKQEEKQKALQQEEKQEVLQQEKKEEKQGAVIPPAERKSDGYHEQILPPNVWSIVSEEYRERISPSLAWSIGTAMEIFRTSFCSETPVSEQEFGAIRKRLFGLESKYITGTTIIVDHLRFTYGDRRNGKKVCPELSYGDKEFYIKNMEPLAIALETTGFVHQYDLNNPLSLTAQQFCAKRRFDDLITKDNNKNIFAFSWGLYNKEILTQFGDSMEKRDALIAQYESSLIESRKARDLIPPEPSIVGEPDKLQAKDFSHGSHLTLLNPISVAFHGSPVSSSSPAPVSVPSPNNSHLGSIQSSPGFVRGRSNSRTSATNE